MRGGAKTPGPGKTNGRPRLGKLKKQITMRPDHVALTEGVNRSVLIEKLLDKHFKGDIMSYIITNESGQYWNESQDCFSVVQAATEYANIDDLPSEIDGNTIEIHADPRTSNMLDIRYYDDDSYDAIASVKKI